MRVTCRRFSAETLPDGSVVLEIEAPEPDLLTKAELASRIGYSPRWVTERVAEGLPRTRLGGKDQFQLKPCLDWLARRSLRLRIRK